MSKERSSQRAPIKKTVIQKIERARVGEKRVVTKIDDQTRINGHTPEGYRDLARAQVLAAWPLILEGLIEKAMGGGYQQAKLLLDLCELAAKEPHHSDEHPSEQLCDALLNNLRLRPPE